MGSQSNSADINHELVKENNWTDLVSRFICFSTRDETNRSSDLCAASDNTGGKANSTTSSCQTPERKALQLKGEAHPSGSNHMIIPWLMRRALILTCRFKTSLPPNTRAFNMPTLTLPSAPAWKDIVPEPIKPGGVHPKLGCQVDSERQSAVHGVVEKCPVETDNRVATIFYFLKWSLSNDVLL